MPKVEFLSGIRTSAYFCREAALVRLKGGLDMIRSVFAAEKQLPVRERSWQVIGSLLAHSELFPDRKWLTPDDIEWLRDAYRHLYD